MIMINSAKTRPEQKTLHMAASFSFRSFGEKYVV